MLMFKSLDKEVDWNSIAVIKVDFPQLFQRRRLYEELSLELEVFKDKF
jgi:hypothetical protein